MLLLLLLLCQCLLLRPQIVLSFSLHLLLTRIRVCFHATELGRRELRHLVILSVGIMDRGWLPVVGCAQKIRSGLAKGVRHLPFAF